MTDWAQLGRARGIPDGDLNRIVPILNTLESAFHSLVEQLPLSAEPAFTLFESSLAG